MFLNLLKGILGKYEGLMFILSKKLDCTNLTKKNLRNLLSFKLAKLFKDATSINLYFSFLNKWFNLLCSIFIHSLPLTIKHFKKLILKFGPTRFSD